VDRRQVLKGAVAGALTFYAAPILRAGQQSTATPVRKLVDNLSVVDAGGTNVVALSTVDGMVLVDTGAATTGTSLTAALRGLGGNTKVQTVFNTHYHLDQTGNNETLTAAGAKILAHDRTLQFMSTDLWVPEQDRYQKARPKAAWPTQVFRDKGTMKAGAEQIDYGYLQMAHTSGDIYVHFKNSNVLAVGDVVSPLRDPEFDWFTGAWIGGRVDAMDTLLKLSNDQTKIVPSYGPVMTRAELKAERDMMEEVRVRLFKQVREGDGPEDMLKAGVLKGLPRTWKDPLKFLYAAAKGLWAHHDKIDANVV
jgi:glyoxylase-like metal-dependent hydrolase (beta-lactamase superfamily II)